MVVPAVLHYQPQKPQHWLVCILYYIVLVDANADVDDLYKFGRREVRVREGGIVLQGVAFPRNHFDGTGGRGRVGGGPGHGGKLEIGIMELGVD